MFWNHVVIATDSCEICKQTHTHTHTRIGVHTRAVRHLFELGDEEAVHVVHVRVEAARVNDGRVEAAVAELAKEGDMGVSEGESKDGKMMRCGHFEIYPETLREQRTVNIKLILHCPEKTNIC